jgi:uncharacterized protein YecT (DUF1311 family)
MKKNIFIVLIFCILISSKLHSQEDKHPIDLFLDSCMDKDPSTAGMVNCTDEAIKMWDNELNKYYRLLVSTLDGESVNSLKSAQLEWIAFRDKEFINIENIYSKMEGTMYIPMQLFARLEIIKARTLQLQDYYELLTEGQ